MENKNSLKSLMRTNYMVTLLLGIIPLFISIFIYSRQVYAYNQLINNISYANTITLHVKDTLMETLWDVNYGQIPTYSFQANNPLTNLKNEIHTVKERSESTSSKSTLSVALQTVDSMDKYMNTIIENIHNKGSYEKNTAIMTQIEASNQLLYDILNQFVKDEIEASKAKNSLLIKQLVIFSVFEIFLVFLIFYLFKRNNTYLNEKIENPIDKLVIMSNELSTGNLHAQASFESVTEIDQLKDSMNHMAQRLNTLIAENAERQFDLAQSELRVLQAQITPHFLYNSLDALVTLSEQGDVDSVKELTFALSDFFRISLSKGSDWITVEKEQKHVIDYLTVLKIRYGTILDFDVQFSEDILSYSMLKMILQPLVENAVYHGVKHVRRTGLIRVEGKKQGNYLTFTVEDNGVGMAQSALEKLRNRLSLKKLSDATENYGLYNVTKRLALTYGNDATFTITSELNKGTRVTIVIPITAHK